MALRTGGTDGASAAQLASLSKALMDAHGIWLHEVNRTSGPDNHTLVGLFVPGTAERLTSTGQVMSKTAELVGEIVTDVPGLGDLWLPLRPTSMRYVTTAEVREVIDERILEARARQARDVMADFTRHAVEVGLHHAIGAVYGGDKQFPSFTLDDLRMYIGDHHRDSAFRDKLLSEASKRG